MKQSYRNRCRLLTAQGPYDLSIPVKHGDGKIKMKDVRIDYRQKWTSHHWRTIRSSYGKAPFFEHFGPMFQEIYEKRIVFLLDLNLEFFSLCQKLLSLDIGLEKTLRYVGEAPAEIQDWRSKIHPKKQLENNTIYKACNYNQIFGKKFVGNLSIIDLLFCEGPGSGVVLQKCRR